MSMKWARCPVHKIQHDLSEKPRELPTATVHLGIQAGVASSWPLATVEDDD